LLNLKNLKRKIEIDELENCDVNHFNIMRSTPILKA